MKFLTNLAAVFAAVALTLSLAAAAEETAKKFSDVSEDATYAEDVYKLAEAGVLNGYGDGTFRPDGGVTRAEMCKMIVLTFNLSVPEEDSGVSFPDVTDDDWFKPYALAAKANNIVTGFEDGSFRGNTLITREQVCAIINRVVKPYDLPVEVTVNDEISDWAKNDVMIILKNKLMPIEAGDTFRATEVIKRYELAAAISKFITEPTAPVTANVRFFVNGEQYGETDTVICGEYPTVPEDPKPEDESFYFDGWKLKGTDSLADVRFYLVEQDTDFEAVFVKKTYSLKFYDGKVLLNSFTVDHGDKSPTVSNPTKGGYTFEGWSLTADGSIVDLTDYLIKEDTTLYAVYKKLPDVVTYTVTFWFNGKVYDVQNVEKGGYAAAPTDEPELDGYVFAGWVTSLDDSQVVDVSRYKINAATDFYAGFDEVVTPVNPNSDELMEMLERGHDQLAIIRMTNDKHIRTRDIMVECIGLVLQDAYAGELITQDYVKTVYADYVTNAQNIVMDEMTTREASNFSTLITNNVDQDVQDFLKEYFLNGEDIPI